MIKGESDNSAENDELDAEDKLVALSLKAKDDRNFILDYLPKIIKEFLSIIDRADIN